MNKENRRVAILCSVALTGLGVLLYALPYIDDKGLTSLVENLATPFTLTLIFFLIESIRDQQKQDEDAEEWYLLKSQETKTEFVRLRASGKSFDYIAKELNISKSNL